MGVIQRRSFGDDLRNFSSDFTSFDRCMQKNLCKIPFIVGCVIGGLIVITVLWCLFRCCLCGYACCSCCCGGCGGGRRRQKETVYVSPAAPIVISRPPPPHDYDEPKYAYFNSKGADALPHMPSAGGIDMKQPIEESHEMENVRRSPSPQMQYMHAPAPTRPGEVDPSRFQYGASIEYPDRAPSAASSRYAGSNSPGYVQAGVFAPNYSTGSVPQTQHGYNTGALGARGNQNTDQWAYGENAGPNPHQYQGSRRQEYPAPSIGHGYDRRPQQRKPEEWTVL